MKIHCPHDKLVPIAELRFHPRNTNKHPKEQIDRLAKILEYQGWRYPIKVSKQSGFVTSGHGRALAAMKLRWLEAPVSFQDYENEAQELADLTSDNAIASWSELDLSLINTQIGDLGPDFDLDLLGIKDFVIEPAEKFEAQCDEDEIPEHVEPKTKLGDLYKLGNHRLMCGDSTSIDAVEKLMNGEKAECVFTDPPYNQETDGGFKGAVGEALKKQSGEIEHLCDFNPEAFLQTISCVFPRGKMNAFIFCNKDLVIDYLNWARNGGYAYNILIWKKPSAIPLGGSYRPDIEYLLTFRKSATWNGGLDGVEYSKVLSHDREKDKVHPTVKPVAMIENQLLISSSTGGSVMDFFGGSGSTLIACEKTNRKCFMMELDPKYCDVIVARWEKFTGQKAELING